MTTPPVQLRGWRVDTATVRAALASAAELGMFFRIADPVAVPGDWQPSTALYDADGKEMLGAILESTRARLGGCEPRVAASLFIQGFAARLLSPQLACIAMAGCVPQAGPSQLWWRHSDTELIQLGLVIGEGWASSASDLIELVVAVAFQDHLLPLAAAMPTQFRIPNGLARGNAAAALVSGLRLLSGPLGPAWRDLAADALARPELRESGTLHDAEPMFTRSSCCLYYRIASGDKCSDCPVRDPLG